MLLRSDLKRLIVVFSVTQGGMVEKSADTLYTTSTLSMRSIYLNFDFFLFGVVMDRTCNNSFLCLMMKTTLAQCYKIITVNSVCFSSTFEWHDLISIFLIILVGLRPSHHQLPACGLRICQTHVLETAADVAETLVQPSGVEAWWKCNLGTQYIKCSIILPIQKLSFEARGGGSACLY